MPPRARTTPDPGHTTARRARLEPGVFTRSRNPLIDKAIAQIGQIINDLETRGGEHLGGHRVKAIESLREAQKELREALAYSRARQDIGSGQLNLNTATADQLSALPGVNEADAKKKVISQETYDKIKDKVVVAKPKSR